MGLARWLNGWVFVYELSGCGFESSCSHLTFRYCACFELGVPYIQATTECRITLKRVCDMITTRSPTYTLVLLITAIKQLLTIIKSWFKSQLFGLHVFFAFFRKQIFYKSTAAISCSSNFLAYVKFFVHKVLWDLQFFNFVFEILY